MIFHIELNEADIYYEIRLVDIHFLKISFIEMKEMVNTPSITY